MERNHPPKIAPPAARLSSPRREASAICWLQEGCANWRTVEMEDGRVTFWWHDYRDGDKKELMALESRPALMAKYPQKKED